MSHRRTWYNAEPPRTGGGAVERASLENWYTSAAESDETSETAKTYDDSASDGQDALAPDLRTDPELTMVVEAWPGLSAAIRTAIVVMAKAAR